MVSFQLCFVFLPFVFLSAEASVCQAPVSKTPACNFAILSVKHRRVRKELRDIDNEQWTKIVNSIWVTKTTDYARGQFLYGSRFRTYDFFIVNHGVSMWDSRGDQSHFTRAFGTYHAAYLLQFEEILLTIDPGIESLPYWDMTWNALDNVMYFGSAWGLGEGGVVADGRFAFFPIGHPFNISDYIRFMTPLPGVRNGFVGSEAGFLRNNINRLNTSFVTRYGIAAVYHSDVQDNCTIAPPCWKDWNECINKIHDTAHGELGSGAKSLGGLFFGVADFSDTTNPNDPMFWFVHNNFERNRMKWLAAHSAELPTYYGYDEEFRFSRKTDQQHEFHVSRKTDQQHKHKQFAHPKSVPLGTSLTEVVNAQWAWPAEELGLEDRANESFLNKTALTHADILCHLGPETSPYRFAEPNQHMSTSARVGL